jgi:hypothetical protein
LCIYLHIYTYIYLSIYQGIPRTPGGTPAAADTLAPAATTLLRLGSNTAAVTDALDACGGGRSDEGGGTGLHEDLRPGGGGVGAELGGSGGEGGVGGGDGKMGGPTESMLQVDE